MRFGELKFEEDKKEENIDIIIDASNIPIQPDGGED